MTRIVVAALVFVSAGSAPAQDRGGGRAVLADSVVVALQRGGHALAHGDPASAVGEFRRAQAFLGLEVLYGRPGDLDETTTAIARGLAEAYLALGDPYAAEVEAARGAAVEDRDARLWTLLGLARHRVADLDGAQRALERAIAVDRREADAHWGLGLVAIAGNRPGEAVTHAEEALALRADPRYALALARWAEAAGDYRRAATALGRWLELRPGDPAAEDHRRLRAFYEVLAQGPVVEIDRGVTRLQLGFDVKAGDEIPYLPVRFNGGAPVYVLFDTGAERNVLDRRFAEEIGLGPILPGRGLHGPHRESPGGYAVVDSLSLGSVTVARVPFAVADFGVLALRGQGDYYIAGVINPAVLFRDFALVLDYGRRRIELVRHEAGGAAFLARRTTLRRTTVPFMFDVNGVWPIVRARVDGSGELPLLVDSGASDILIARPTAAALRLDPLSFTVAIGDYRREGLRGILLDRVPEEPWGIAIQGILGYPLFRGARVALDYRTMVMILEN